MAHLMEKCGSYFCNGAVEVLGAKIDFPVKLVICIPDFMNTASAVCATSAIRRYGNGWAGKLSKEKMFIE